MTTFDLITATFAIAALYTARKPRVYFSLALGAAVIVPILLTALSGLDGLFFAISGGALALICALPLSLLGQISRTDVLLSVAVAEMLGAFQYIFVFAIASVFLLAQRAMKIYSRHPENRIEYDRDSGLIALDEQSALVEIEAMKILHTDRKEFEKLACIEGFPELDYGSGNSAFIFPWAAKIALATVAVLLIESAL